MQFYIAPLEGITDHTYRAVHHRFFPGADRYFTPFFSPTVHRALTPREMRELPRADETGFSAVPQLLTKEPEDFLWFAGQCRDLGYEEVNLNLGCPSGTVTAKKKGSGMLRDPEYLDRFLEQIFERCPLPISVKTRIGFSSPDEFSHILSILNRYPIAELTVHPRVRDAFYNGPVDMEAFSYAAANAAAPLCYNGNIHSLEDIKLVQERFPDLSAIMIGRGIVADPGMLTPGGTTREKLEAFHDTLLEQYLTLFGGSRNAMFRMKEHWRYLIRKFDSSEKAAKQLRKVTDLTLYRSITREIFRSLPMRETADMDW